MHAGEHSCMCLVPGCMSKNMRTRGSCWSACRRTCHVEIEDHQSGEDPEISQSNAADFGKMAASQNSRRTLTSCRHPEIERRNFEKTAPPQNWARSILRK